MTSIFPASIVGVAPNSAASRCGMLSGDVLLTINGMPLRDAIDVLIYGSEAELELQYERAGERRSCAVRRHYGEPMGLEFSTDLFDGEPRVCRNRCEFCFVAQMRPGLRSSLYIKDDDYRLSFLHGNYITLTNLSTADWARIEEQYLSPLYVSVHATEPTIRVDLMRNPQAGRILEQLHQLADSGIEMHTQAVLVPGRNDGLHLNRTISELAALYPAVLDLSVVPVGLTRWHAPDLRVYTDAEAKAVLDQLLLWQTRLRDEFGVGFVYPSDEWFLRAGVTPPGLVAYDERLPELSENGIGMLRSFLDGHDGLPDVLGGLGLQQTWVTGQLFAPQLRDYAQVFNEVTGIQVDVVAVSNQFFGESVTVAGLLTVQDILATLKQRELGDIIVLPSVIFRGPDQKSLDGNHPEVLVQELGRPVYLVDQVHDGWTVKAVM